MRKILLPAFRLTSTGPRSRLKFLAASAAILGLVAATTLIKTPKVQAGQEDSDQAKIRIGFEIAPVHLDLRGKNPALVGLGSYIVNGVADCNGCHSNGPQTEYKGGQNPYFGQPQGINQATYLAGGRDFGPLIPGSADIISRNLTPDKTGLPAGGRSFDEFLRIIRTGVDLDQVHPTCSGAPNTSCVPPPFDGNLLQIMPWPNFKNMNDRDIRAIFEYLRAIPCNAGPPAPSVLHNDC